MKIPNPNNPVFVQTNNGVRDARANIAGSWNCDFTRHPGKVMPSERLVVNTDTADEASLETVNAIEPFDSNFWAVDDTYTYTSSYTLTGDFSEDTNINAPGQSSNQDPDHDISDMVSFDGAIVCSLSTQVYRRDDYTNDWTKDWFSGLTGGSTLNSAKPHPMEVLRIGSPVLAVGDGNLVHTAQGAGTYTATMSKLTLDASQQIRWIKSGTNRAYIGTNFVGRDGVGVVYEWDGGDTVPTRQYKLDCKGSFTAEIVNDTLYVLNTNMELLRLDGGGFVRVSKFPLVDSLDYAYNFDTDKLNLPPVAHRGMKAVRGKLLINICSQIERGSAPDDAYLPYYPSGVWEFDPATGRLSHKYSYTLDSTGVLDVGQWAIPALSGKRPGPIAVAESAATRTIAVAGAVYTDDLTTTAPKIFVDDFNGTTKRRARFWTNQIFTPDTSSYWQTIALKYSKMKNAADKILVKYRTSEDTNYPIKAKVVWTDDDTFTSTETDLANAVAGDEVFVISGNGGGSSAHITSITEAGGTYTVELDESVYGVSASDEGSVAIENFKKLDSFNDQINTYREMKLPTPASGWIQVLIELRSDGGDSPILEELDIIPTKHQ